MIPWSNYQIARLIHEERIRAAQARRPEWMYEAALAARQRQSGSVSRRVRFSMAQVLRQIAASIEPNGAQPALR
jgi:hypothetical protein